MAQVQSQIAEFGGDIGCVESQNTDPQSIVFDCVRNPQIGTRFTFEAQTWEVASTQFDFITPDQMRPWVRVPGYRIRAYLV